MTARKLSTECVPQMTYTADHALRNKIQVQILTDYIARVRPNQKRTPPRRCASARS